MRRAAQFIILFVISAVILTGCKQIKNTVTAKKPEFGATFSCSFSLTAADGMKAEGVMKRSGAGEWEMDITSPETMAGLHIAYGSDGVKAGLDDLTLEIPPEKVNETAVFRLIFSAVDNCAASDAALEETDEGYIFIGSIPQGDYTLLFDSDDLSLSGISIPAYGIEVKTETLPASPEETAASEENAE